MPNRINVKKEILILTYSFQRFRPRLPGLTCLAEQHGCSSVCQGTAVHISVEEKAESVLEPEASLQQFPANSTVSWEISTQNASLQGAFPSHTITGISSPTLFLGRYDWVTHS